MGLKDKLKKLLDPVGPIGEVISPADVYKTHIGLPTSSPHTIRAALQAPADVEKMFAPERFVALEDAKDVPHSRIRQVTAYTEEHWAPVYMKTDSTNMMEILKASQTQIGWKVTMRQTAASKARLNAEQFLEVAQSCQIVASDEFYNGVYPTIPGGNDPIVLDGEVLRGTPTYDSEGRMTHDGILRGTVITGGRREYEEKTKGMVHWDKGFVAERNKFLAEYNARPIKNVRENLERTAGQVLPMRRLLANPRYDRKSGS